MSCEGLKEIRWGGWIGKEQIGMGLGKKILI